MLVPLIQNCTILCRAMRSATLSVAELACFLFLVEVEDAEGGFPMRSNLYSKEQGK